MQPLEIGKGRLVREGQQIAILSFGTLLSAALGAADEINATVADMRFVKPLDTELIDALADDHALLVTIEENVIAGGAGSAVCEYLNQQGRWLPVLQLGLPDQFIDHGKHPQLLSDLGLDSAGILSSIQRRAAAIPELQASLAAAALS
jgi:1-deoxy-D-xylulose-5-phosphate synthase